MSAAEKELRIRIAGRVDSSLTAATTAAQQQVSGLGSTLSSLGKMAVAGLGGMAVGSAITSTISTYKDFDQAMAQTAATAGAVGEDYQKLQQAAMEAGKGTTKTATEAAQALGYLALAGYDVNQSTEALMPVLKLSEATQMDLAQCSDLVTDSMSAAGVSVAELPGYLDVLCKANNKSNQTAQQLMEAMIGVGGTMRGLNVPIEETSTALGVLANRGIKGAEGGTALNSIMANLTTGAGQAGEMMEKLGISAFDSNGKFIGVQATLMKLNDVTKNLTEEERNAAFAAIGGKEQVKALNALMDGLTNTTADGTTEWNALNQALLNSGGALDEMNAQVTNTLNGAMSRFGSALDDVKIRAGLAFGPALAGAINNVSNNVMPMLSAAMDNLGPILASIGNEMQYIGNLIANNWGTIEPIIKGIGVAFATWKLTEFVLGLPQAVSGIKSMIVAQKALTAAKIADKIETIQLQALYWKDILLNAKSTVAMGARTAATNAMTIATKAWGVACKFAGVASKALFGAFSLLTMPVGLVVVAITAAVAAGVLLYKNWDVVKAKAAELWTLLRAKFTQGAEWLSGVWDSVKEGAAGIAAWFSEIGSNIMNAFINSFLGKQIITKISPRITRLIGVITDRFSDIKDGLVGVFSSVTNTIGGWINSFIAKFTAVKTGVANALGAAATAVSEWFASTKTAVSTTFAEICAKVNAFISPIMAAVSGVITTAGQYIVSAWNTIIGAISGAINTVVGVISTVAGAISSGIEVIYGILVGGLTTWATAINAGVYEAFFGVQTAIGYFIDAFGGIIDFLTGVFMGNWGMAWQGIVDTFGGIFSGIQALATAPINGVIALINSLISKINSVSFDVPSWVPDVGGKHFGFDIPSIPALAEGGIATAPTLAMIGEGAESEAVMPLSKLKSLLDFARPQQIILPEPQVQAAAQAPQVNITVPEPSFMQAQAPQVNNILPEPQVLQTMAQAPQVNNILPEIDYQQNRDSGPGSWMSGILDKLKKPAQLPLDNLASILESRKQNMPASAPMNTQPMQVSFSPQITIQGSAGKEETMQAMNEAFSQFKAFMARYEREHRRFAFSQ